MKLPHPVCEAGTLMSGFDETAPVPAEDDIPFTRVSNEPEPMPTPQGAWDEEWPWGAIKESAHHA